MLFYSYILPSRTKTASFLKTAKLLRRISGIEPGFCTNYTKTRRRNSINLPPFDGRENARLFQVFAEKTIRCRSASDCFFFLVCWASLFRFLVPRRPKSLLRLPGSSLSLNHVRVWGTSDKKRSLPARAK